MSISIFNHTEDDERAYLAQVVGKIAAELDAYSRKVSDRHAEARELVTDLQEGRSNMDHIEKASMRQSVNLMTRITEHSVAQQRRLSRLVDAPYFGRVDVNNPGDAGAKPIYIGVHSFHEDKSQLIHDWRAPISSMFYEFELGDACYDAPGGRVDCGIVRKRQYRIEKRDLVFMLETSLNIQDAVLQEELSRASDDRMRNIVATIQRDQNAIIRNDRSHSLVIQGAAGSGKTSVALHRIAYLLYKHKDTIRSEDILIISPNRVFAHYISQVLPELGEEMIRETTVEEIAGSILGHRVRCETFFDQVTTLLSRHDEAYGERVRFKATTGYLGKLEEYARHMQRSNFLAGDVLIDWHVLKAEWVLVRFRACRGLPISEQVTRVTAGVVSYMKTHHQLSVTGPKRAKLRADLTAMFACTNLATLYKNFYAWLGEPRMFQQAKGGRYEYSDVFPLIYLKMLVDGASVNRNISHVVIDEMQDYTPVQYKVIDLLYPCKKTILGDRNQSVSPLSASDAESIAGSISRADCVYMHKSYRSTLQITELAQTIQHNPDLIPIERHGDKPVVVACKSADLELDYLRHEVSGFRDSGYNALGIICKTQKQADRLHKALGDGRQRVHLLNARSTAFTGGVMIATAYLAKGLEFDRVIVPFCSDEQYHADIDRHMLYVACTRAMHKLTLTHTGVPSPLLASALGGALVTRATHSRKAAQNLGDEKPD